MAPDKEKRSEIPDAAQHSTAQHGTAQHGTAQQSTAQPNPAPMTLLRTTTCCWSGNASICNGPPNFASVSTHSEAPIIMVLLQYNSVVCICPHAEVMLFASLTPDSFWPEKQAYSATHCSKSRETACCCACIASCARCQRWARLRSWVTILRSSAAMQLCISRLCQIKLPDKADEVFGVCSQTTGVLQYCLWSKGQTCLPS